MKSNFIPAAIIAATVVLAAMLIPAFANAAPVSGDAIVQVTVVNTSDLDLSSEHGMSALKSRIADAANRVCGETTGTITPQERFAINACRAKARHAALAAARSRGDQVLAQR
jgi:UrcA family protein